MQTKHDTQLTALHDPRKEFIRGFEALCYGRSRWEVFRDFCEMSAIALRQPFYRNDADEQRYMAIINQYDHDRAQEVTRLLACVMMAMERCPSDFLGSIFMELNLGNDRMGQFFTPYSVSLLMAKMTNTKEQFQSEIDRRGYVTMNEPCCGAGGMIIAFFDAFLQMGFNPQTQLLVIAQDLDIVSCWMTYIQIGLLGVPAGVIHCNTLTTEHYAGWWTPMYFFRNWRLRETVGKIRNVLSSEIAGKSVHEETDAAASIGVEDWEYFQSPANANIVVNPDGQMAFNF